MSSLKTISIVWIVLSFSLCSCQAQNLIEPLFVCSKVLHDQYGICSHINRNGIQNEYNTREMDLSMMDKLGVQYVRTDFDWIPIQTKKKGYLNFVCLDSMVTSVRNHKKSLLGILTIDKRNYLTDDWLNYVYQTCKRNKKIKYWEMLNEVDLAYHWVPGFYSKQYVPFLKEGYRAVKRANKKALVTFTGFSNIYSPKIDSIFSEDVGNFFDIMSVHTYTLPYSGPEDFIGYFHKLKNVMGKYKINKPVWLSETGSNTCINGGVSEEEQSLRLPRIFLISFALGIDKVFWYKSRSNELDSKNIEGFYGIWHSDYTPKPAFYAYQTLTRMCPNKSTRPKLERYGDVYIASWKRPDRGKVWALWTSKKDGTVALNIKGNHKVYDNHGKEISMSTANVNVTPSVIYIVGAKSVNIQE